MSSKREHDELVHHVVGQILSNYQAALHVLEESGEEPPAEVLRHAASDVFTPVLEACAGTGLEELVAETIGSVESARERNLVIAERQRVAATHSRLIRRRPALLKADPAVARRLEAMQAGSHSAGALFLLLSERYGSGAVISAAP